MSLGCRHADVHGDPPSSHAAMILVLSSPEAPELEVLRHLPPHATILAIGNSLEKFAGALDRLTGRSCL